MLSVKFEGIKFGQSHRLGCYYWGEHIRWWNECTLNNTKLKLWSCYEFFTVEKLVLKILMNKNKIKSGKKKS